MAHIPKLTNLGANASADAVCALCNGGHLKILDGTQAVSADTAISGQNVLANLTLNATAAAAASGGVATFNAITPDSDADATGTASWFRVYKSDGTTAVFDGSVGTSLADLNLSTTAIVIHATVTVTSLTYTQGKG